MKQIFEVRQLGDLNNAVSALTSLLNPSKNIILLNGDLGAGKTTFVIEYCKHFGLQASSPTFSLIQNYKNEKTNIAHVDLYRLDNDTEIDASGFWDLFTENYNLVFIEWSTKLNKNDLPLNWKMISLDIKLIAGESRELTLSTY